jgi:Ca-activated chloride channel family protein
MGGLRMRPLSRRIVRLCSTAILVMVAGCSSTTGGNGFADLWWTADQQGRRLLGRGEFARAAERFEDPMWKGVAHYRDGNFEQAAEFFGRVSAAEAAFNLGKAHAGLGRYEEAVGAYEAALAERPDWREAIDNRDAVAALIPQQLELPEDEQGSGEPSFDPDEIRFDEKGQKGRPGEIEQSLLTDEQLAEMWLRRLQTSPAGFLRQRFALEAASESTP